MVQETPYELILDEGGSPYEETRSPGGDGSRRTRHVRPSNSSTATDPRDSKYRSRRDRSHMGPFRTKSRILRRCDWGGLNRDVDEHVAQCPECQMNKPMKPKPIKHLKPIRTNAPNEMLQVDFLKMVKDDEGYEYIVMMIDHFTKFCVPYPVKKPDSRAAVEAIMNGWIAHHGFPPSDPHRPRRAV